MCRIFGAFFFFLNHAFLLLLSLLFFPVVFFFFFDWIVDICTLWTVFFFLKPVHAFLRVQRFSPQYRLSPFFFLLFLASSFFFFYFLWHISSLPTTSLFPDFFPLSFWSRFFFFPPLFSTSDTTGFFFLYIFIFLFLFLFYWRTIRLCGFLLIASRILSLIFDGLLHFLFFFFLCLWRALTVEVKWGVEGGGEGALTFWSSFFFFLFVVFSWRGS